MDGNRRWARSRGMPPAYGHGAAPKRCGGPWRAAREHGIHYLTLFAFSSENWRRPANEVGELMDLLRFYLRREIDELARNGVRLRVIGERDRLAGDIAAMIDARPRSAPQHNAASTLTIALNYGSRREIARPPGRSPSEAVAGALDCAAIDEDLFDRRSNTLGLPDPDLLIRTSGEQRLSQFPALAAGLHRARVPPVHWPEFDQHHLEAAIAEFRRRERRYGGVGVAERDPALRRRVLSALAMLPIVIAVVWWGGWVFAGFVALAVALMAWEWGQLSAQRYGRQSGQIAGGAVLVVGLMAILLMASGHAQAALLCLVGGALLAGLAAWLLGGPPGWIGLGVGYLGLPALALIWLRSSEPDLGPGLLLGC